MSDLFRAPDDLAQRPNTVPWPPILMGLSIISALIMQFLVPIRLGWTSVTTGMLLIVIAFSLDVWVFETFRRHKTEIMPHKPARSLVTEGPFRFSRNPIYLGNILIILAGLFLTGSVWFVLSALGFVATVTPLAIAREERHLSALFGAEWSAYAEKVRRWI